MRRETALILVGQSPGLDLDIVSDYCGWQMDDDTTVAVSGDEQSLKMAMYNAIYKCGKAGDRATFEELLRLRWENRRGRVVAY